MVLSRPNILTTCENSRRDRGWKNTQYHLICMERREQWIHVYVNSAVCVSISKAKHCGRHICILYTFPGSNMLKLLFSTEHLTGRKKTEDGVRGTILNIV